MELDRDDGPFAVTHGGVTVDLWIDGKTVSYMDMLMWISLATSLHAPSLAMPAGQTPEGLPVGVQIVGPWNGEDRLFDLAAAVEEALGGFKPPPGV